MSRTLVGICVAAAIGAGIAVTRDRAAAEDDAGAAFPAPIEGACELAPDRPLIRAWCPRISARIYRVPLHINMIVASNMLTSRVSSF